MPIRNFNPFKKAQTAQEIYEQNNGIRSSTDKGFQDASVKATAPIEIQEPTEYKLSEINDSGVYLPPSPTDKEKSNFFSRSTTATSQSSLRSALSQNEPFNISRESFDSYRRSFDISARSPISTYDAPVRQSLDSRRNLNAYSPRPSFQERERRSFQQSRESFQRPRTSVEDFEDVGLNDEPKVQQQKRRSLFSRFGDNADEKATNSESKPQTTSNRFLSGITGGRKRGQSGTGSELSSMPVERPESRNAMPVEAN